MNVRKYYDKEPATLNRFDPKPDRGGLLAAQKFIEQFKAGERPSLYLFSRRPGERLAPGNGKTMLAVAIVRALLEWDPVLKDRVRFSYVPEMVDDYRRQYNADSVPEDLDRKYTWPELLVMDDFGAQRLNSDYPTEVLNRVIYRREARSTIYTSNLDLEGVEAKDPTGYIERATSRIAGECRIVCMSGPDRRLLRAS